MLDKLVIGFLVGMTILLVAMIPLAAIYTVVGISTEADCLEAGFPKSAVTWNLKKYCMNLEGTVTVAVEEIE